MSQSSLASTDLILAVPGDEQMRAMPRKYVREAYARGEIEPSQLVWSPEDNEWKELKDLPHLLQQTQMLAPAAVEPTPAPAAVVPVAKAATAAAKPALQPVVTQKAVAQKATLAKTSSVKTVKSTKKLKVREDGSFSILRWIALVSFLVLVSFVGVNYYFVDQPFQQALKDNSWDGTIITHAHLGGFFQRDVVVIHLLPSPALTEANLLKSLTILARSTPLPPWQSDPFQMVALSPQWQTEYLIPQAAWHKLGDPLDKSTDDQKIALLADSMETVSGTPLLLIDENKANIDKPDFVLTDKEKNTWKKVVATFVPSP